MVREPTPPIDISMNIFTLQKSVMVGNVQVVSDTDFPVLGEFNFRKFQTMNVRRVADAAKKGGFEFEADTCTATVSAKGVPATGRLVITVNE